MLKRNEFLPSLSFKLFYIFGVLIFKPNSTNSIYANPRSNGGNYSECCNVTDITASFEDLNSVNPPTAKNISYNITETDLVYDGAINPKTIITSPAIQPLGYTSHLAKETSSEFARTSFGRSTIFKSNNEFLLNSTNEVSSSTPFSLYTFSNTETGNENLSEENLSESHNFNSSTPPYVLATVSYTPYIEVPIPGNKPAKISKEVTESSYIEDRNFPSSKLVIDNLTKELSLNGRKLKEVSKEHTSSIETLPRAQSVFAPYFTWLEIVLLNTKNEKLENDFHDNSKFDKQKQYYQLEVPLNSKAISLITNQNTDAIISSNDAFFYGNYSNQNTSVSNASYNGIQSSNDDKINNLSDKPELQDEFKNLTKLQDHANIYSKAVPEEIFIKDSGDLLERQETARSDNNHNKDNDEAVETSLESPSILYQSNSSNVLMIDAIEQIRPNYLGVSIDSSLYHQPATDQTNGTPANYKIDENKNGQSKDTATLKINNANSYRTPMSVSNEPTNIRTFNFNNISSDIPLHHNFSLNPSNETHTDGIDSWEIMIDKSTENLSYTTESEENISFVHPNKTTVIFVDHYTVPEANVTVEPTLKQGRLSNFEEQLFSFSTTTNTKQIHVVSNGIQDFGMKSKVANEIAIDNSVYQMISHGTSSKPFPSPTVPYDLSDQHSLSTTDGKFTTQTQYSSLDDASTSSDSDGESSALTSSRTTEVGNGLSHSTKDFQFSSSKSTDMAFQHVLESVTTSSADYNVYMTTVVNKSYSSSPTKKGIQASFPYLDKNYDGFSDTTSTNDYNNKFHSVNHSKTTSPITEGSSLPTDFRENADTSSKEKKTFYNYVSTRRTVTGSTPNYELTTEGRIFFNLCFTKKPFFNSIIKSGSAKSPAPKEISVSNGPANTKVFWNLCPTKKPNPHLSSTTVVSSTPDDSSSTIQPDVASTTETVFTSSTQSDEETTQSFEDQKEDYPVYWNVPTFQCHKYGLTFRSVREWGLRQNHQDQFRGEEIAILYDPGDFPALLPASAGRKVSRNGGVPQEGSLSRHLSLFQSHLEKLIPDVNFTGLAIIDFEHWRPIWRQNWGTLSPYRDFSRLIERRKHPFWFSSMIEVEATYRYELGARVFLLDTLRAGKRLRPRASWGYYGYPFCFNYTPHNNRATCSYEVQMDNDSMDWLFSETTAYYPSLYLKSKDMYPTKRRRFIKGRLDEAMRLSRTVPVYPYVWYKYHDTNQFLSKEDMKNVLKIPMNSGCKGAVIWGASRDVNSREKCLALQDYLDEVIGPAVKEIHSESYRTEEEENLDEVEYLEEEDEEDKDEKKHNYDIRDFEV